MLCLCNCYSIYNSAIVLIFRSSRGDRNWNRYWESDSLKRIQTSNPQSPEELAQQIQMRMKLSVWKPVEDLHVEVGGLRCLLYCLSVLALVLLHTSGHINFKWFYSNWNFSTYLSLCINFLIFSYIVWKWGIQFIIQFVDILIFAIITSFLYILQ